MSKINKTTLHYIIWYILIFSILGLILETIYCYATTGVLESRKGLLIGPVCPIYGIGATILICLLTTFQNTNNKNLKIFLYGILIGSTFEYLASFVMEAIYSTRFWEYSYINLNVNGRICITYSLFWGILSLILMNYLKPKIDNFINKIPKKHILEPVLVFLFIFDNLITMWSITTIKNRAQSVYYNTPMLQPNNSLIKIIENNVFSNNVMLKIFPNLRFIDNNGNEIFIRNVLQ